MKMTLDEVMGKLSVLAQMGNLVLPIKVGYAIRYNVSKMDPFARQAEDERRRLCELYAKRDENGKPKIVDGEDRYDIGNEDIKKVFDEYTDFLKSTEVEFEIRKISKEDLENIDANDRYSALTIEQLGAMDFMIGEYEENE